MVEGEVSGDWEVWGGSGGGVGIWGVDKRRISSVGSANSTIGSVNSSFS